MEPIDEWSVDANEALSLSLHSPSSGKQLFATFHPKYTYAIFGDSETIFGYRGLNVRLAYAVDDMAPCVDVTWTAQKEPVGGVVAEDVIETLKGYLPERMLLPPPPPIIIIIKKPQSSHRANISAEAFSTDLIGFETDLPFRPGNKTFKPPGALLTTFTAGPKTFEIWASSIEDPACKALLSNIQILTLLYIEGGSYIELDDDEWSNRRWGVFFLYEKPLGSEYSFIGYSTVYRYYYYSATIEDLSRARISQFLILPPYQRRGLGSRFYDALIAHFLASKSTLEITVEDPSESFADMRDVRDLCRLETSGAFKDLTLESVFARTFPLEDVRRASKIPQRQFSRCVEMSLLKRLLEQEGKGRRKQVDRKRDKQWKMYRLIVKGRVYKQNRDVLAQLDRLERVDKLEETYFHVEDDYKRLLEVGKHVRVEEGGDTEGAKKGKEKQTVGSKRNSDTEEGGEEVEEIEMGGRPKKRVRF